jgi:protocatechuate 3,4-dioxygenase beta subunit
MSRAHLTIEARIEQEILARQQAGELPLTLPRRLFTRGLAFGAAMCLVPGAFANELTKTPRLTEGPFYPDKMPLDTDNDLLMLNDAITPAVGEITHLSGRILSTSGEPIRNAFVEIWQVDNNGAYLHSGTSNRDKQDKNFQGYGRFLTDSQGNYYFRTIKPVPYPGRTPHIHFGVSRNGKRILTTQLLIKGHPQNDRDGVTREVSDPKLRELIMADFAPIKESKIGELAAKFDLVIGATPNEQEDGAIQGGIGKPEVRGRRRG